MAALKANKARLAAQCSTKSYRLYLHMTRAVVNAAACAIQACVKFGQGTAREEGGAAACTHSRQSGADNRQLPYGQ